MITRLSFNPLISLSDKILSDIYRVIDYNTGEILCQYGCNIATCNRLNWYKFQSLDYDESVHIVLYVTLEYACQAIIHDDTSRIVRARLAIADKQFQAIDSGDIELFTELEKVQSLLDWHESNVQSVHTFIMKG